MSNTFKMNLETLAELLKTVEVGKDFWASGGQIATAQEQVVRDFLDAWLVPECRMGWAVVETLREMRLGKWDALKALALGNLPTLARVRIFGEGGDMTLHRNEDMWLWHFVGDQRVLPTSVSGTPLLDGSRYFFRQSERALLWGEDSNGVRTESRVAAADLNYAGAPASKRLAVVYDEYAADGVVQFVWFRDIVTA